MARFQILSLIGGGIRGAFITSFLNQLEQKLGRPVAESFDLIAGTNLSSLLSRGSSFTVSFDDGDRGNFSEKSLKAEVRPQGTAYHMEPGKFPVQAFHQSAGCFVLIHMECSIIVFSSLESIHNNRITSASRRDLATNPAIPARKI